jgi:DNA-binding transcriptional LysR family regulator
MKITWLEDFLALVDSGNFSRAAEARGTAQPAFSRHIQGLEDWAGTALFERERRPVSLTAAGRLLRPSAESIISQLNQVRDGIRQEAAAAHTLKFAATHTLSMFFFPMWFRSVEGTPEVVNISLQSNHMDTCAKSLIQGECQFLICFTHPSAPLGFDPEAYESKVIGHERLIPVCAPDESGQPLFPGRGDPVHAQEEAATAVPAGELRVPLGVGPEVHGRGPGRRGLGAGNAGARLPGVEGPGGRRRRDLVHSGGDPGFPHPQHRAQNRRGFLAVGHRDSHQKWGHSYLNLSKINWLKQK